MILEGTLRFVDVGMGAWVLERPGERVALLGKVPRALLNRPVRVTGEPHEGVTAGMVGRSALRVAHIEAIASE